MKENKSVNGLKAWAVFLPTIILIFLIQLFLGVTVVLMNKTSERMSNDMQKASNNIDLISTLSSGSSVLSETAISFVETPVVPPLTVPDVPDSARSVNMSALSGYIGELTKTEHRSDYILAKLKENELGEEDYNDILSITTLLKEQIATQAHAILLLHDSSNAYTTIGNGVLELLGNYYTLTAEEKALPYERRAVNAKRLLFSEEYAVGLKKEASTTMATTINDIRNESNDTQDHHREVFWHLRRLLWAEIALIIIVYIIFFIILIKKLINPITRFANNISEGEKLDEKKGLYEANYLAKSYNDLLNKKSDFENRLTSVAETDPLTGFDNRYSYNKFLASKADSSHSTCIFMLDINNLKYVNDTFGHDKGDELIKNSSLAIKETFMNEEGKNCYRLGGDEFIAIIDNIDEANITNYIFKFQEKQKEYNVSIATGYAYTDDISIDGYEKLMIEADKRMYDNKKEMKEQLKNKK